MKRLRNHFIGVDQGAVILFSDFEEDGKMWTGEGLRMRRRRIAFREPYRAAPAVHVSLNMWDMSRDRNQRADLCAEEITATEFDLVFRTWGDTQIARVRADWMAIGELRLQDDWEID